MKNSLINEFSEAINSNDKLLAFGNKTKTAIGIPKETFALDLSLLKGIIEYEPSEYTFTASAGTSLEEIDQMLAENDQFLPFDPPLVKSGATLGGTVASNLSGPGRYHFGGVRDFVLGVQFLDGEGRIINSGGKVVKNAAGFDIPKFMVGSLGSLGTLTELSIKVFPRPQKYKTLIAHYGTSSEAIEKLIQLTSIPIEILCLELEPTASSCDLRIRIGGSGDLFDIRVDRLKVFAREFEILDDDSDTYYWEQINEFQWLPDDAILVKVPITPKSVLSMETFLNQYGFIRRYSVGANVAWIAWSGPTDDLDNHLIDSNLSGLTILGSSDKTRLGAWNPGSFYQRIKKALDPLDKWVEV